MAKEKDLLIEFLQNYSVEAIHRAVAAYEHLRNGIAIIDIRGKRYFLKVRSESNVAKVYNATIAILKDGVFSACDCDAYARSGSCKHAALAAIYILIRANGMTLGGIVHLLDLDEDGDVLSMVTSKAASETNNGRDASAMTAVAGARPSGAVQDTQTIVAPKWKQFSSRPQIVFQQVGLYFWGSAPSQVVNNTKITGIDEKEATVKFDCLHHQNTHYKPAIRYDGSETFYYQCDCRDDSVKMCYHVKAAFARLERENSHLFFTRFKNWDIEKNALLRPYGLVSTDKEALDIKFTIDNWGNITMKQPDWLWKADFTDNLKGLKHIIAAPKRGGSRPLLPPNAIIDFEIGFLFNLNSKHFNIDFELEPVQVHTKNNKQQVKKLSLHQNATPALLKELPDELYDQLLKLSDDSVKKYFRDLGQTSVLIYSSPWDRMDSRLLQELKQYYISQLQRLWPQLCGREHLFILREGSFNNNNIAPVALSPTFLSFSFVLTEDQRYITISLRKMIDGEILPNAEGTLYHGFLFEINERLYLPGDAKDVEMLRQFERGFIKIPISGKAQVIRSVVPLLQKRYSVEVPPSFSVRTIEAIPEPQLLLKEMEGKFLVLQPQYKYQGITVNYEENPDNLFMTDPGDGSCIVIVRDAGQEKAFFESIKELHPKFKKATKDDFFFLPFEDTMKKNWFIDVIAGLVQNNIPVMGIQDLEKHRYNANKPVWEMKVGSGIDWFDVQIDISFGEQSVALRDVRKALMNGQNIVVLGDGTFGVLPEEWLNQYGLMLKMADEQKDGTLRVSKMHYTLIDELHSQINDEEILREIAEKKQRLQNIGDIKVVKPGKEITATLRPYQLTGFQWLHTLDEMGWGGCLADDMGLGKTLQVITFLQYLKGKYKGSTHLVICPTSLVYNWENELKKFGPALKYHIYYGVERELNEDHFNEYDLVITSYGIIRNDLEDLMQFEWHYIILDESQAIKNPDAQTNKALQLLKSKNRLIMSGTPIQNNTYDLFAQFNFINPGLLGNREFFRTEFANPIDKKNDSEKSAQLRRLIYPFMLRRTKEQVATDLPDKTETVLWCEMGKEQRRVYDDYKNYYREKLMEKIREVGMAKAGMFVLEGLLRLRQICDSPVLVKDKEVTTAKSVKIEELMREIEENTGGHKLLVFSLFTEMLHLIEEGLRMKGVDYAYLDGSTTAERRREAVATFQEDPSIRVFLISLKAGGVGLNLTAADYVYLVDPWWNPAVEQQAIDRTHRIGQVNKIFAYKMICKNTVEEKIMQLQQRKKQIANELVTEDAGFIKKLTKEDVAFLFS